MRDEDIAYQIAMGLIKSGVEGPFNAVSCSTAGDYPSMGVSQWEGARGDHLLDWIKGGSKFIGKTYSDIVESGELEELASLLESEQGIATQKAILTNDCLEMYIPSLTMLTNSLCKIYAGIWCPTSHNVVNVFLQNRLNWGYDINDLQVLYKLFSDQYAQAADCEEYAEGYQNRAFNTYVYCSNLDLSNYG